MMYCGIAERRGRVHGCACAVGLASAVQGACIGCAFVCCWPQGWGAAGCRCGAGCCHCAWVHVAMGVCSAVADFGRSLGRPGGVLCVGVGALAYAYGSAPGCTGRPAVGWSLGLLGDFEFQHSSAGMATSGAAAAACCCSSPLLNTAPHAPFRRSFVISGRSGGSWTGVKILENT